MIKALARAADGRKIALLGITDKNIEKLREGKPIQIHGEEMGLDKIDIWIITGKDEAALQDMLGPMIDPKHTDIRDHRGEKKN